MLFVVLGTTEDKPLPQGAEVQQLFLSGHQAEISQMISKVLANKESAGEFEFAFLLSVCSNAMSYSKKQTLEDYELSRASASGLVDFGVRSIVHQSVLLDHIAQNNRILVTVDQESFRKYRRETADEFARIYELANKIYDPNAEVTPSVAARLPEELWQKMRDLGIKDERGHPIWGDYNGPVRKEYEDILSDQVNKANKAIAQSTAQTILSGIYNFPVSGFFVEQYSRIPYDYVECNDFLQRIKAKKLDRKAIICKIASEIQVKPPPELGIDCGVKTGEEKGF